MLILLLLVIIFTGAPSEKHESIYPEVWLHLEDEGFCHEQAGNGWSGSLAWPTNQTTVAESRAFAAGHPAIDIVGDVGDPIYAAESGVVSWAGWSRTSGNLVVLSHGDGWTTYYAHLDSVAVQCGEQIETGEIIGRLGKTKTNWAHLHFEVEQKENGVRYSYNPLIWLSGAEFVQARLSRKR